MSAPNTGGPAFPSGSIPRPDGTADAVFNGMTLRDWFAGQALQQASEAIRTWPQFSTECDEAACVAQICYDIADAMLAERERGGE